MKSQRRVILLRQGLVFLQKQVVFRYEAIIFRDMAVACLVHTAVHGNMEGLLSVLEPELVIRE